MSQDQATLPQAHAVLSRIVEAKWDAQELQTFLANWGLLKDIVIALKNGDLDPKLLRGYIDREVGSVRGLRNFVAALELPSQADAGSTGGANKERKYPLDIFDTFKPLTGEEAVRVLVDEGKREVAVAEAWVTNWLEQAANSLNYFDPVIAYRVRLGFRLSDAPMSGHCRRNFRDLFNWMSSPHRLPKTEEGIVFFIPKVVPGSSDKNVEEQIRLLGAIRIAKKLPEHHAVSFGHAALIAGLALAHKKRTQEFFPGEATLVKTDTFATSQERLELYRLSVGDFGKDGLNCKYVPRDHVRGNAGFVLVGIEPLLSKT